MPSAKLSNHPAVVAIAVGAVVAIGVATLAPVRGWATHSASFFCLYCDDLATADIVLNVLLFAPLGLALRELSWPWARILLTASCLTLVIELLQFTVIPGRDASLRDLLANSAGAAFGAWCARLWRPALRPGPRLATRLVRGGAAIVFALLVLVGWSWTPSFPQSQYFGQRAHDRGQPAVFQGRIMAATAGAVPIPIGRLRNSAVVRSRLKATSSLTRTRIETDAPPGSTAPIVGIYDDSRRMVVEVAQEGQAVTYDVRQRANDLRLRKPRFRLAAPGVLATRGNVVDIEGSYRSGRVIIGVTGTLGAYRDTLRLSPGLGWTLLAPFDHALRPWSALVSGAWLLLLVLPLGYWWANARGGSWWLVAALFGGLALVPAVLHVGLAGPWEWAGCVVGLALGRRAGQVVVRNVMLPG